MIIQRILEVSSFCSQTEGMPCARISSFSLPHTWDESKYSSPLLSCRVCSAAPSHPSRTTSTRLLGAPHTPWPRKPLQTLFTDTAKPEDGVEQPRDENQAACPKKRHLFYSIFCALMCVESIRASDLKHCEKVTLFAHHCSYILFVSWSAGLNQENKSAKSDCSRASVN